ncbi:hypothetical protein C1646_676801 [Rhizophagus diaphanus]|nr:hypothetical protein C1646_676801 [Rhizophagus diaphanus] [Rhizophagus sp. MUCL 43196]
MYTSTISDQTDRTKTTLALRYDGAGPLTGVPSHNEIIAEYNNGMTAILQQSLSGKQPIHFMPTEVSDDTKYIIGVSTYILRVSGCLINGQKAIVNITGIRLFFDVKVPEEMPLSIFKTKLAEKSSLAYYLKECKLDNKLDVPFHHMFKYYGRALKETNTITAEQMREVAKYCIIDAINC